MKEHSDAPQTQTSTSTSTSHPWQARRHHANRHSLLSLSTSSAAVLWMCGYWYGFIWRTQQIMDDFLHGNTLIDFMNTHRLPSPNYPEKYIVFTPMAGQGLGNQLNGLLAAHLLGDEFGRIVCVGRWEWKEFYHAMEYVHPQAQRGCEDLPVMSHSSSDERINLLNFAGAPNECQLRDKLASDQRVFYFTGNTYPRWCAVPPNYWFRHYRPTQGLLEILPWKDPPHTVVHLRHGDSNSDPRLGLDHNTLVALGESLPSDTFLVTNWVEWFDFFETKYGWRNSNWMTVKHSALTSLKWGSRDNSTVHKKMNSTLRELQQHEQNLQMWSDWYTVIMAKYVIHTHSDFSLSAIHWMNIDSKTIHGLLKDNTLDLVDESWRVDDRQNGVTPKLSQRTKDQLRLCDPSPVAIPRKTVPQILAERRKRLQQKEHAEKLAASCGRFGHGTKGNRC
jgi:hypothetical protein